MLTLGLPHTLVTSTLLININNIDAEGALMERWIQF